jgi:hypothetical protein
VLNRPIYGSILTKCCSFSCQRASPLLRSCVSDVCCRIYWVPRVYAAKWRWALQRKLKRIALEKQDIDMSDSVAILKNVVDANVTPNLLAELSLEDLRVGDEIHCPLSLFPYSPVPYGTSNCSPIARQAYPLGASPLRETLISTYDSLALLASSLAAFSACSIASLASFPLPRSSRLLLFPLMSHGFGTHTLVMKAPRSITAACLQEQ